MPRGACVIRYDGARGVSWRVKYADADGRQVKERSAANPNGTGGRQSGRLALASQTSTRGCASRRAGRSRTSQTSSSRWALAARPRKKSTVVDYTATLRNHLSPVFDDLDLGWLSQSPELFERYAADKIAAGLSPKTVRNHLVLAGLMFRMARRWRWVSENPLDLVDKPSAGDADTETIDASAIADLLAAYRVLELDADEAERFWFANARRMTVVALSTGLRRGELLGLRWQDVELLERRLSVVQQVVRNEVTTPKSQGGEEDARPRPVAAEALEEQYKASGTGTPESHRVLASGAGHSARPVEAVEVREDGAPKRGCRTRSGRGTDCVTRR